MSYAAHESESIKVVFFVKCIFVTFSFTEMEKKLKEEREAREKAENRVVQIEKQCSMLDVDLKQTQQKLEHLIENKDRMEDEVRKTILTFIHLIKEKIIVMTKKSV